MNDERLLALEEMERTLLEAISENDQNLAEEIFGKFIVLLETGKLRSAYKSDGVWKTAKAVKRMILLGFRIGVLTTQTLASLEFCDKHVLFPSKRDLMSNNIRIVPGGTSVRAGAFLSPATTIMPPSFINIGAFVDEGTMIDSHVTVGSCAQIGKNCHISAAVQIGGVLEPINAIPTIVEDNCFIGGNSGIFEGTQIHNRAIIAAGTILTKSTKIYDLPNERIITAVDGVLHVPENAVIVPGSRPLSTDFAKHHALHAYTPILIKYRDEKSDASTTLESLLR